MIDLIPCIPPAILRNPHLHTIVGDQLPSPMMKKSGKKMIVDVSDGDKVVVEFYEGTSPFVFTLCHGLSGHSRVNYMQRMAIHLQQQGHSVALMNHRNCGIGMGLAKLPYHSGRGDDLGAVIKTLRQIMPRKKQVAIGFSMSGNLLLRLLTVDEYQDRPDYAICVNPSINLERSVRYFDQGLNRLYEAYFINNFRSIVSKKYRIGILDKKYSVLPWMKIQAFDDMFTAPRSSFSNALTYYRECSTKDNLHKVNIPTVIITSKDDPFISYQDFLTTKLSATTHLHIENFGGHMGYLNREKTPLGTHRWMDYALMRYAVLFS